MPFTPPPQLKAGLFGTRGTPKPKTPGKSVSSGGSAPRPKGVTIEHRIGVQAPAEVIWEIIYNLDDWARWNPLYTRAAGVIRLNAPIDLTLQLPGQEPRQIQPTILEWVPNEQLHWKLSLMSGLVKTVRYVEIEALAEASCIVSNGEIFGGMMGSTTVRQIGGSVRRGFIGMNEALKAEAEQRWRAAR